MTFNTLLNKQEAQALDFIAERYSTGELVRDRLKLLGIIGPVEVHKLTFHEDDKDPYLDALKEENGDVTQTLPTCCGGTLALKLTYLYEWCLGELPDEFTYPNDVEGDCEDD